jgi:two-component system, OmpR family, phosphate regulon sensor histidine kinase PhoR
MPQPGKHTSVLDLHASHTLVLAALWACPVVLIAGAVMGWPLPWLAGVCCLVALAGAWTLRASIWKPMAQLQQHAARATRQLATIAAEAGTQTPTDVAQAAALARTRIDALERERAAMLAIFDAVQSPLLVVDVQGQAIAANAACMAFFASRSGVIGRHLDELFTQPAVLRLHARALTGEVATQTITMSQANGPRVFLIVAAPTKPQDTTVPSTVLLSLRDITDLAQASALKTAFVANASHELRTPLSSIRIAIDTLADGAWDDAAMRTRLAEVISDNTQRLDEMVRDLMELSRLESPDMQVTRESFALSDLFTELHRVFDTSTAERGLQLVCEQAPSDMRVHTDRKLLLLIVRNLVDNALKFAREGTSVRLLAEALPLAPGASRDGPRAALRIRVIDEGLGIPVEHQQRIFERFYQVDTARTGNTARRGTGLGLAIVKHSVKDLGGTIRVESVWKQGTTMIVELPATVER